MRVLITGAAGFLGRWFSKYHLEAGDDVLGIDDFSNPYAYWEPGIRPAKRVIYDAGDWFAEDHETWDRAYHFASPVGGRIKIERDPLFNADAFRLDSGFIRWAVDHVSGEAVYPSSSAVYGVRLQGDLGSLALREDMFRPDASIWDAPDMVYGATKLIGELLAIQAADKYNLPILCIRPFSGYGEGQSLEYPIPSIINRARHRETPLMVWGSGRQTRDFIHVEDLVHATIARLDAGLVAYEAMNIGTGIPTSFVEIAALAAQIAGYDPPIITDETKPEGVANRYADVSYMSTYYTPTISLKEGLRRVMEDKSGKSRFGG